MFYVPDPTLPPSIWTNFSVQLFGANWKVGEYTSGGAATDQQMKDVLGTLTALYINADWLTNSTTYPNEFTFLDNVKLDDGGGGPDPSHVPEPSSFVLFGLVGVGLLGGAWRRRRQ